MNALVWITKEAKHLRKKYPRRFKEWKQYVAQASAIYSRKHKGKSPVGKKKSAVKKIKKRVHAKPSRRISGDLYIKHEAGMGTVSGHLHRARKQLIEQIGWMEATKITARTRPAKKKIQKKINEKKVLLRKISG